MMNINGNLLEVYCDIPGCTNKSSIHTYLDDESAFRLRGWYISNLDITEALCPSCKHLDHPNEKEEEQ